jgi:D-alanyl-D-alanine carboxypeptidase
MRFGRQRTLRTVRFRNLLASFGSIVLGDSSLPGLVLPFLLVLPSLLRADEIDDYVKAQMARNHIPGLAIAITRNAEIIKLKGYGLANLEWDQSVTPDTAFPLASSTKPLTGMVLMQLVEEGKLRLDDKISKYLPEAPLAWQNITVRHLATHSSGIRDDIEARKDMTIQDYVRAAAALPLAYPPGERAAYGIAGYIVLTRIMEAVSRETLPELIRTRLVNRLGLTCTQFDFATDQDGMRSSDVVRRRAGIYNWESGKYRNFSFLFPERSYSAGGLLSSAADLAKLGVALDNGTLLSGQSVDQMWRQDKLANGTPNSYGIGWVIKNYNGRKTVGHSGGPALSDLLRFPDEKLTIAVLTNGQNLYPYLAQGVADFFIPPLAIKVMKGIEDKDPRTTEVLKKFLTDAAGDQVNESLFSADAQKAFVPAFKTFGLPFFKSLDTLQSFILVDHKEDENGIARRYQAIHGKKSIVWNFRLTKEGKITALEPTSE